MDFKSIEPLLSAETIYTNSTQVANVNNVPLTMWDVTIAALITRLNLFYVGEAGPGKTQLANDVMNVIFNGQALDLRGSLDLNLNGLLTRMRLDKLAHMTGTSEDAMELTEKVRFNLAIIDELNRCPPVIQNQFFNITDGYLEFKGKKVYLGADGQSSYFVGIGTGNMGNGEYTGTFSMDNALRDRLHLTLDFDYYYPSFEDTLSVSLKTTDPRVKVADKHNYFNNLLESYKQLNNIYSKVEASENGQAKTFESTEYMDAYIAGQFLDHGLDYVKVDRTSNTAPTSKRQLKNVYPDILVQQGANAGGDEIGFIRPFTLRGVNKTMSLAIGLAAVACAKSKGEFTLNYETVLEAYRLILPYSGALTAKLLDNYYSNPSLAADSVAGKVRQEVEKGIDKAGNALAKAAIGTLDKKDLDGLKDSWSFAKAFIQSQNTRAIEGKLKEKTVQKNKV